jgi:hypothetical protein
MLGLLPSVRIHFVTALVDMRKGIDGLRTLIEGTLKKDPFDGHLSMLPRASTALLSRSSATAPIAQERLNLVAELYIAEHAADNQDWVGDSQLEFRKDRAGPIRQDGRRPVTPYRQSAGADAFSPLSGMQALH